MAMLTMTRFVTMPASQAATTQAPTRGQASTSSPAAISTTPTA